MAATARRHYRGLTWLGCARRAGGAPVEDMGQPNIIVPLENNCIDNEDILRPKRIRDQRIQMKLLTTHSTDKNASSQIIIRLFWSR